MYWKYEFLFTICYILFLIQFVYILYLNKLVAKNIGYTGNRLNHFIQLINDCKRIRHIPVHEILEAMQQIARDPDYVHVFPADRDIE